MTDFPQIPGYNIERLLGRGGMASVYLALQKPMNRYVALKVMSTQADQNVWAKRFIQEAQVIAQLAHPGIVPVYDVGSHNNIFYIAMEYLKGGSLKKRLKRGVAIPDVLKIFVGVAAGLDFAGEKGFVHRDIKPDNIMFREDGSPVILDFGIVKQIDESPHKMTQTGIIVGTTCYMSPEQAQGQELDHRSDIYSLGVMFFELLTGKAPYKGESDIATLLMHVNQPLPQLPPALKVFQPIINKALAKDPFHRYTRAREMIDHIERYEAEISALLARIKESKSGDVVRIKTSDNDEDATLLIDSGEKNAISVTTGEITTEEELNKVIKSAKATIKDFSGLSNGQKARKGKSVAVALVLFAFLAISYAGYEQFYRIPHQERAAEAKKVAYKVKKQQEIKELLYEAKVARAGMTPHDFDRVDNVIAIYREVLTFDESNQEALAFYKRFGQRYIQMAKGAVRRGDVKKARVYRDYAKQLVPFHDDLGKINHLILSLREKGE